VHCVVVVVVVEGRDGKWQKKGLLEVMILQKGREEILCHSNRGSMHEATKKVYPKSFFPSSQMLKNRLRECRVIHLGFRHTMEGWALLLLPLEEAEKLQILFFVTLVCVCLSLSRLR
jgi:hypothetical protein